jgi:hypothetical protein
MGRCGRDRSGPDGDADKRRGVLRLRRTRRRRRLVLLVRGNVYTKNADKRVLAKMLTLASRLGAKVQGDDGEPYSSPGDLDLSADELFARIGDASPRPKEPDDRDRASKWRFWRR